MNTKALAALLGAGAWICLAAGPAAAATAHKAPVHHPIHTAALLHTKTAPKAEVRDSTADRTTTVNRQTIVSVGPQAMAIQRIRDIAMAPTG